MMVGFIRTRQYLSRRGILLFALRIIRENGNEKDTSSGFYPEVAPAKTKLVVSWSSSTWD